jgi:hypothetical protein
MTWRIPKPSILTNLSPARSGILQRKCACGGNASDAGQCAECQKKQTLQRHVSNEAQPGSVPPIVHDVLRSPGQPLDAATRAFMEPRFGHDFGKVRVHADSAAADSARAVNANAYTVGHDIVLGSRPSAMSASEGRRLMAHELTHVVQQSNASASEVSLTIGDTRSALEQEADRAADAINSDLATPRPTRSPDQSVQRDTAPEQNPTATQSPTCQSHANNPADKGYWQGFYQQALQGVAGNEKFKKSKNGPRARADAACEVANFCVDNLLPRHNKQVECAVKDLPRSTNNAPKDTYPPHAGGFESKESSLDAATKFRLFMGLAPSTDWGDSFRSALQSTTAANEGHWPLDPIKAAADIADQAVANTGDVDIDIWKKYMACKRPD